ncbi:hypothetical protein [Citrobacter cronae]|uniref:hypothetical protein n=1 Tax=Citrobacter cronae TaxID=1748967 RepID=UPI0021D22986|nr:hypothetical protein [Citrobacter cronae]MCU6174639.1 hypothetical protein [Citrobacter cronae]
MSRAFIFTVLISSFLSIKKTNAENIITKEYGYGSLYWELDKHNKPSIYNILDSNGYIPEGTSIRDILPSYSIGQNENIDTKNALNVSLLLSITNKKRDVIATVKFLNKSKNSLYIYKKNIPSGGKILCDNRFLITSKNINIDYLGGWCNYGSVFYDQDWLKIPAKKRYSYSIILNKFYDFLPGNNVYNIGSFEQIVVSDKWLTTKRINNSMFRILNWIDNPPINKSKKYTNDNIANYFYNLGFNGQPPAFYIRTNEVAIKIDGDKIKSFYAITK